MRTIQLEIPDELAAGLAPYSNNLLALLELGLQTWRVHERQEHRTLRESILQSVATSGKVGMPQPYTGPEPYVRHTPIPVTGKPVSELLIAHRGLR